MTRMDDTRLAASASLAAVLVAGTLVALKAWALVATGSLAIAASLADSAIDLVASATGLVAILYAARPADDDHAFGHAAAEDLAALGQAALVAGSAALIGWQAVERLISGAPPPLSSEGLGIAVMAASIVMTAALVAWQRYVARRTGSRVVAADSLHYLADLLPALGAIVALGASAAFGAAWVDPAVGLAAAALLGAGSWKIARGAWDALMDRSAGPEVVARLREIADGHPGLRGWHDLKTRTSGRRLFVQIHVEIDGRCSLAEAHAVGAALRHRMLAAFPQAEVIVHKDPV